MEEDVENEKSNLRDTSNAKSFTKKIFQNVLQILHSQETDLLDCDDIDLPVPIWTLLVIDFFVGQFVICPLMTLCWISAWLSFNWLLNDVLFPDNSSLATFVCLIAGVAMTNGLGLMTPLFHQVANISDESDFQKSSLTPRFVIASRLYTIIDFLTSMILWKGWWELCKQIGSGFPAAVFFITTSCLSLICLRKLHSNIGFPFNVSIDNEENYRCVGRRLKSDIQETWMNAKILNTINCAVTTLTDILTISSWYGIWTFEDNVAFLLSADVIESATLSLVTGLTTGLIVFSFQFFALWLDSRINGGSRMMYRLLVGDFVAIVALISTVSNLRGLWIILDIFIPVAHHPLYLSGLFASAFLILALMGCVSSLHGGKVPDASKAILLPGFYFTYFACKTKNVI